MSNLSFSFIFFLFNLKLLHVSLKSDYNLFSFFQSYLSYFKQSTIASYKLALINNQMKAIKHDNATVEASPLRYYIICCSVTQRHWRHYYVNYYNHYISQLIYQREALMLYDFLLIQKLEKLL